MIEFKRLSGESAKLPIECIMVDGCHVGYWHTPEGSSVMLFKDLSEAEEAELLEACMESRGWIPPQVIRQAWGKLIKGS